MKFSQKLQREVDRLKLTQAQLAELLEVSPRAVWDWLKDDQKAPAVITQEGALARLARQKTPSQKMRK